MIYIIDEDEIQLEPFKIELEILGFEVQILADADEAYRILTTNGDDLELAIIDVMLATDESAINSRFTRSSTRDFLKTGICLLEDLAVAAPLNFPRRAVLFSTATDVELLRDIVYTATKYGIPYLNKNKFVHAYEFGKAIREIIDTLGGVNVDSQ